MALTDGIRRVPAIAAPVLTANIGDKGRWPLLLHLESCNKCIFGIDDDVS